MVETEVIVVGGGPAGSTCARELVRRGVDCLLLDKCDFPRPKPCAGWITPRVRELLELAAYPHALVRLRELLVHFRGRRLRVPTTQYSVRRIELDRWLLDRCGAPFRRHAVERVEAAGGFYVIDGTFRCRFLVGAGGTYCPVYRALFRPGHPRAREAMITTLEEEIEGCGGDERCRLWFFDHGLAGYSWYVPKGPGVVNVGLGGVAAALRSSGCDIRRHWNLFTGKLEALGLVARRAWHPRGGNYYVRRGRACARLGNAFLVGDAAGLATRDMGEGIGAAVESGIRAAAAIAEGRPYRVEAVGAWSVPGILTARLLRVRGRRDPISALTPPNA